MKTFYLSLILSSIAHWTLAQAPPGPNVILIMADDQGYGDIRAHGHPFIRTPNMDRLHAESVRFTDFHVAPMCTPTRGQLLTGVDAMKNGATAVCQGRSMIRREIPTLADYFAGAGYRTILSGKWHLGDSYPHRPQDRGFQEVLSFRAWGLPSLASHWANSYINPEAASDSYHDPVLEYNGTDKPYQGYVTDIFFDHAMEQIEASRKADQPFFVYIATPTPHTPNISPPEKVPFYQELDPYEGKKVHTHYYGMIENIDDNLGRIERFINDQGLRDNTILIYLSDNGTQSQLAKEMYNAGMRAKKTSVYEGGHRVPLFVRWPDGDLKHGQDVAELTQVQDLCPTLLTLCGIKPNDLYPQSGHDLTPLLKGVPWPHAERTLIVQYMAEGGPGNPPWPCRGRGGWSTERNSTISGRILTRTGISRRNIPSAWQPSIRLTATGTKKLMLNLSNRATSISAIRMRIPRFSMPATGRAGIATTREGSWLRQPRVSGMSMSSRAENTRSN
jgi:arylsulfatase A-like enzyme